MHKFLACLLAVAVAGPLAAAESLLLTGSVQARQAQKMRVPLLSSWAATLKWIAPEGQQVAANDVVARFDPADFITRIANAEIELRQIEEKADKELADLEVTALASERALREAQGERDKAALDAGVPLEHRSALQFDRFQLDLTRAEDKAAQAQRKLEQDQTALARRLAERHLDQQRVRFDLERFRERLSATEVRAERAGAILYSVHPFSGQKTQAGGSMDSGQVFAEIVDSGDLAIRAWLNEVDSNRVRIGAPVQVRIDALPQARFVASVERIAGRALPKPDWGPGNYLELELALDATLLSAAQLSPGMSALLEIALDPAAAGGAQ